MSPRPRSVAADTLRVACIAASLFASACADPSGPATNLHSHRILIPGTEEGAIVVDLDWRGIIRRSGPRFVSQGPVAVSGRGELITVGRIEGDAMLMAGLDIDTGLELWRTAISEGTTPLVVNGVELGATMLSANPSRPEVFLWRSTQNGVAGVAGYDYEKRRITRFIGPLGNRFRAMAAVAATTAHPEGCVVLGLDTGAFNFARAYLHVVCGASYADRDSIPIDLPSRIVVQMEPSADGRELIVMTDVELLKIDVTTMEVKHRATRPIAAPFFMSRATGRLIVTDVGADVVASTSIIYLLDATLELSAIIDLRVLPFGQRPLGILGAEESSDGKWLYIVGGVPRGGPLYGPEETHVLVIDKATGIVSDIVNLDTFGGSRPFLVP